LTYASRVELAAIESNKGERTVEIFTFGIIGLVILAIVTIAKTATIVPQQQAYVVENLGKYSRTLRAGFHILIPFIERVAYKHSLKEVAVDIPEQVCITLDNVQVGVDGVLYMQILDPKRASYGIQDYVFAISQLAQTTLRSEIGKIDLDRTFVERATINANVVSEVDLASDPWGVKILRYEIRNINPPRDVIEAMEKQMRAEREKRAVILESEGVRDANINRAEGEKQQVIKESEARRQSQINEAEGEASAIEAVATATAEGLRQVASAVASEGGHEAMQLRVAEQYVAEFGNLAKEANTLVIPANLSDVASMIALATKVIQTGSGGDDLEEPPHRRPPAPDDFRSMT
jgi:regulator of protease activity HflC (stomatin/prohibitin superfamily)